MAGSPPPINSPRISLIIKAIFEDGPEPGGKSPIMFPLFRRIWSNLGNSYDDLVWKAALSLGFFLGLRSSEYAWDPRTCKIGEAPSLDRILIYYSKGDMFLDYSVPKSKTKPHGFHTSTACSEVSECCPCSMAKYLEARKSLFGQLHGLYSCLVMVLR